MNHELQVRVVLDGPVHLWQKSVLMLVTLLTNEECVAHISESQVSFLLGVPEKNTVRTLNELMKQGWLEQVADAYYRVNPDNAERLREQLLK